MTYEAVHDRRVREIREMFCMDEPGDALTALRMGLADLGVPPDCQYQWADALLDCLEEFGWPMAMIGERQADIVVSAGGGALWELAALGIEIGGHPGVPSMDAETTSAAE